MATEIDSVSDYIQSTSSTNDPDGDSEDFTSDNSVKKRPRLDYLHVYDDNYWTSFQSINDIKFSITIMHI